MIVVTAPRIIQFNLWLTRQVRLQLCNTGLNTPGKAIYPHQLNNKFPLFRDTVTFAADLVLTCNDAHGYTVHECGASKVA